MQQMAVTREFRPRTTFGVFYQNQLAKVEVAGSNPVVRSKQNRRESARFLRF